MTAGVLAAVIVKVAVEALAGMYVLGAEIHVVMGLGNKD